MEITVNIPDETAARMLNDTKDPASALLELAGYTACANGRISEYEFTKLLGLQSRFEVHAIMKRIQLEGEALQEEFLQKELAALAEMREIEKTSKSG